MASTSNGNINEEDPLSELTSMSISVQRKMQQPQQQKMTRRALNQYITDTYGSGKTESEKEFIITLYKYGDFSLGLLVVYIFTIWVIGTTRATIFYKAFEHAFVVRCRIPALEECFNFSQILNISVKNRDLKICHTGQYCRYDVRDYADLTKSYGCNYTKIISEIANSSVRETRPCEEFVVNDNVNEITPRTYYEWYCEKQNRYQVFVRLEPHAEFFLTGLLATIADLFGRKRAFIVGSSLHMVGNLIILLPSEWCLYIGVMVAASRGILLSSLYVLTLELCSKALVVWMGVLLSAVFPVIRTMRVVLEYTIRHWIYRQLALITMSLVLPFGMWYINESPRWLMFTGNKPGAWKALMEWESDVQPDDSDMYTSISEKPEFKNILKFFYKPQFRKRITACSMLWFLYYISKYQVGRLFIAAENPDYIKHYVITVSLQFAIVVLANVTAAKYGRKRTMYTLYCISTPLNAFIFMQNLDNEELLVTLVIHKFLDALKTSEFFILLLYTSEMFPTPYRVTALNICLMANSGGLIIQDHLHQIFRPTSQGLKYMPIFLASVACMLIVYFLPETRNEGLPDTPRDAVYLTTVH